MKRWGAMFLMVLSPMVLSAQTKKAHNLPNARPAAAQPPDAKAAPAPAAAPADATAAPAEFVQGFAQLAILEDTIAQIEQQDGVAALESRAKAMSDALRAQLPAGKLYDPAKQVFYTPPIAAAAAPTAAPSGAQPPAAAAPAPAANGGK